MIVLSWIEETKIIHYLIKKNTWDLEKDLFSLNNTAGVIKT